MRSLTHAGIAIGYTYVWGVQSPKIKAKEHSLGNYLISIIHNCKIRVFCNTTAVHFSYEAT